MNVKKLFFISLVLKYDNVSEYSHSWKGAMMFINNSLHSLWNPKQMNQVEHINYFLIFFFSASDLSTLVYLYKFMNLDVFIDGRYSYIWIWHFSDCRLFFVVHIGLFTIPWLQCTHSGSTAVVLRVRCCFCFMEEVTLLSPGLSLL